MWTLFRRIRHTLVNSGSSRRYLLYALGEVALVVLGILIALQINNWNEQRKDVLKEQKLLAQISEDMQLYEFHQNGGMRTYTDVMNAAERLLIFINDEEMSIPLDSLNNVINMIDGRWLMGAGSVTNIYDLLITSGSFELLSSEELRKQIRLLNSHLEFLLSFESMQAAFVDEQLSPFLNQYVDRLGLSERRYRMDPSLHQSRFKTSLSQLKDSRTFANLLMELIRHTNVMLNTYGRMGNMISTIDSIAHAENPSLNVDELRN